MKLSQAIEKVYALANKVHSYWETEGPKHHPHYPLVYPGEEELPPPPEEKQLAKLLARLPKEMVYQIALIVDLGRMFFDVKDRADYYKTRLKREYPDPAELAGFMASRVSLAGNLEDGLEVLKKHNIDVDKISLRSAPLGK